ncbi:MAG: hypothetical protein LBL16_02430 [Endomicrobium sp.]|jgi:site-specific DNA-methyltransferase (adenine-specific)|nr:hypothetical protein [Endomicrobium sp.]
MEQYFQRNNFILYNGDCIKVLQELPENSIDMIFANPPFFIKRFFYVPLWKTCQG